MDTVYSLSSIENELKLATSKLESMRRHLRSRRNSVATINYNFPLLHMRGIAELSKYLACGRPHIHVTSLAWAKRST